MSSTNNNDSVAKHLLLNSIDAVGYDKLTSLSVIKWNLYDPQIALKSEGYFSMWLESVQFPSLVYPINEFNNYIIIKVNNVNYQITVPPNNYGGATIATELQTLLNATSTGTWTITWDFSSTKIFFLNSNNSFQFQPIDTPNSLYEALGIVVDGAVIPATTVYEAPYPVNLIGTRFIDIVCNLETSIYSTTHVSNYLARIPTDVPYGGMNYYYNFQSCSMLVRQHEITSIELQLHDDHGNPYVLPPNANISINLWIRPLIGNLT